MGNLILKILIIVPLLISVVINSVRGFQRSGTPEEIESDRQLQLYQLEENIAFFMQERNKNCDEAIDGFEHTTDLIRSNHKLIDFALETLNSSSMTDCDLSLYSVLQDAINYESVKKDKLQWDKIGKTLIILLDYYKYSTKTENQTVFESIAISLSQMNGHYKEIGLQGLRDLVNKKWVTPPSWQSNEELDKEGKINKITTIIRLSNLHHKELVIALQSAVRRDCLLEYMNYFIKKYPNNNAHSGRLKSYQDKLKFLESFMK